MELTPYSRQSNTPLLVDKQTGETYFDLWQGVEFEQRNDDILYPMSDYERLRPDLVAYRVYGTTDLAWVVLQSAGVLNPLDGIVPADTAARSPVILGQDGRPCLRISSLASGPQYNSGGRGGLTCRILADGSDSTQVIIETYLGVNNLPDSGALAISPLETLTASSTFIADNFWTYANSRYLGFQWLLDTRDPSPPLPKLGVVKLWGGTTDAGATVRMPSLSQIRERLG